MTEKFNYTIKKNDNETFTLLVTKPVEKKIREWCMMLPHNEWSGVLFYTVEGDFENDLKIVCKDILVMNIGESAFTEFSYDEDVAFYMAQNPELLDCYQGLIHSHNTMATFFSGTDISTLDSEGKKQDNFVSLIVNNAGNYSAAITKKTESEVTYSGQKETKSVFKFFGNAKEAAVTTLPLNETTKTSDLEYFKLNVEKEECEDSEQLQRFSELSKAKEEEKKKKATSYSNWYNNPSTTISNVPAFKDYNTKSWEPIYTPAKQGTLFEDYDKEEEEITRRYLSKNFDKRWKNAGILRLVNQIVLGTPYTSKDFNPDEFLTKNIDFDKDICKYFNSIRKYYPQNAKEMFESWASPYLDFLVENFDIEAVDKNIPAYYADTLVLKKVREYLKPLAKSYFIGIIIALIDEKIKFDWE